MDTKTLRAAMKAVEPGARVASTGDSMWTVRVEYKLTQVRAALAQLGLYEYLTPEIEGSRWDWTHVLHVAPKEEV